MYCLTKVSSNSLKVVEQDYSGHDEGEEEEYGNKGLLPGVHDSDGSKSQDPV